MSEFRLKLKSILGNMALDGVEVQITHPYYWCRDGTGAWQPHESYQKEKFNVHGYGIRAMAKNGLVSHWVVTDQEPMTQAAQSFFNHGTEYIRSLCVKER